MGQSQSAGQFGATTTADQVGSRFKDHAIGKYVLITGGSGGLGKETARILCKYGADVMVTCRTEKQGNEVVASIKGELPDAKISFGIMSLDDLVTIKAFSEKYTSSNRPLDILINNAGIMACDFAKTKQGFESQLGVNFIGHYFLTKKLLPALSKSGKPDSKSRVINVSSLANYLYPPPSAMLWDDLSGDINYNKWERYGQSKLANILHANELNRRFEAENLNIVAASLHPGVIIETDLARHNSLVGMVMQNMAFFYNDPRRMLLLFTQFQKSTAQGAATSVLTALDPQLKPAGWYVDCRETTDILNANARDAAISQRLCRVAEEMIKPFE